MKYLNLWFFLFVLSIIINSCDTKKPKSNTNESISKEVLFFGQKHPGTTPTLFAQGLVSTNDLEIEAAISSGMDEFYFARQIQGESPKSHLIQYIDGKWKESIVERLSGEVFISPDNKTMYLGSKYKERTSLGWSEEKSLGASFEQFSIMRLTVSNSKTYVFDEREEQGKIRFSRVTDGKREDPIEFNKEINTGIYTSHPFIAPDESYLIWDSEREGGYGGSDLYISFRQEGGSWSPAINMGDKINTQDDDTYGSVTSDGKYFFFNRVQLGESFEESYADIYWVDAQVIMKLKE